MRIRYILLLMTGVPVLLAWASVFVLATVRGSRFSRCPACDYNHVRPSYPTIVERVLGYTGVIPFRCENCRRRFYGRKP